MGTNVTYFVCNKCGKYCKPVPTASGRCPHCDAILDKVRVNEKYAERDDFEPEK